jgi:hypothetical protein
MLNDILTVISSLGRVTFEKYRAIYETLMLPLLESDEHKLRPVSEVLIHLEALGHCEVNYETRHVTVCPPTLVLLPQLGLPEAVLIGGRDEVLLQQLLKSAQKHQHFFKVSIQTDELVGIPVLPSIIKVVATSKSILSQLAERLNLEYQLEYPAAYSVLTTTPNLKEIEDSLVYSDESEPNWKCSVFNPTRLRFVEGRDNSTNKLMMYTNPITQQQTFRLWAGKKAAAVDKNWGRYLSLQRHNISVLLYDVQKQRMAVPLTIPLPKPIHRAAVICSGLYPRKEELKQSVGLLKDHMPVIIYERVPDLMAQYISTKLGQQQLYETNLI